MKKEVKYLIADKLELFGLKINKRFWDIVEYKIYFLDYLSRILQNLWHACFYRNFL